MVKTTSKTIIYLIIIIGIFILLNVAMVLLTPQQSETKPTTIDKTQTSYTPNTFLKTGNETTVEMKLPAVDTNKSGVTTSVKVTSKKGTGRTLVDIDGLLFWADTQQSIRVARQVAAEVTKTNVDEIDLTYAIKAQASVIGGPSAGGALTIATIAALEGKKPAENVMMTGAINHDGSIGPVSEILEKAKAAKRAGATIFLVPLQQSQEVVYETSEHCENYGNTEFCNQETLPRKVDISKEVGLQIVEVSTVQEAMNYFFP